MEGNKLHRAWLVLIGCCLLMMSLALITTIMGFFVQPVSDDMGFERGAFTIYYSLAGLVGVVAMPIWGRIIPRIGVKMAVAIAGTGGAFFMFLFSMCKSLPGFYATGLAMGIMAAGMTVLPASILVNAWFVEKKGLAMGIAMACSGVGGAIFSPVMANIIATQGWQTGYVVNGLVIFLLTVPAAVFLLKGSPSEVGLQPYGVEEQDALSGAESGPADLQGVSAGIATKSLPFIVLAVVVVLINMAGGAALQHLPGHLASSGIDPATVGGIFSVLMIVLIVSKILLGIINDRFGSIASMALTFGLLAISFVGFNMISTASAAIVWCVLYGAGLSVLTVMPPLLTGQMFGQRDYSALWAIIGAMGALGLAIGTPLMGLIFDKTGSYAIAFYTASVIYGLAFILMIYALRGSKKLWTAS